MKTQRVALRSEGRLFGKRRGVPSFCDSSRFFVHIDQKANFRLFDPLLVITVTPRALEKVGDFLPKVPHPPGAIEKVRDVLPKVPHAANFRLNVLIKFSPNLSFYNTYFEISVKTCFSEKFRGHIGPLRK